MKKIFFVAALLCASMMANAADYCDAAITSRDGNSATVTMRLVAGTTYEFSITTAGNIVSFNAAGSNLYAEKDGVGGYHISEYLEQNGNTLSVQFSSSVAPRIYANDLFIVLEGHGEDQFIIPTDASWAACGELKTDPELSINATEKTLDAATHETFQLTANRKGNGAISFQSKNEGIATVSNNGLVTAVGRGTTQIEVSCAETETYAIGIQYLTLTVTGPINWDALNWLTNGTDKYKLSSNPEIPDGFGGKKIEGENLWIGFPSAEWGDNSGIEHSTLGAGVSFPLSQFTKKVNEFNFICAGVTYAISLYYADGTATGMEEIQNTEYRVQKVIENGQLVIVKNDVRYDVTGAQIK